MAADFDTNLFSVGLTKNDVLEGEVAMAEPCDDDGPPDSSLAKSFVPAFS